MSKKLLDYSAWLVSGLFTPPLVAGAAIMAISFYYSESISYSLWWGAIGVFLLAGPAVIYILQAYRKGQMHDITLHVREERIIPLSMALVGAVIGTLMLAQKEAPLPLIVLGYTLISELALLIMITIYWKISVHALTLSSVVTLLVFLQTKRAALLYVLLFPVAWARVYRKCHTFWQVTAGSILGAVIAMAVFRYFHYYPR